MGISPWQLLIVLLIIVLIFGTKKLRNIGGDLGGAVKNFKKSIKDESQSEESEESEESETNNSESEETQSKD